MSYFVISFLPFVKKEKERKNWELNRQTRLKFNYFLNRFKSLFGAFLYILSHEMHTYFQKVIIRNYLNCQREMRKL